MTAIHQVLKSKGPELFAVHPMDTVYAAITLMAEKDVGALLVTEGGKLIGMITERQYARDIILKGRASPNTFVRDIMEARVLCVEPDDTVETCMQLMTRERVRHLPVVQGGRVVGIVSIGDLVKSIIDEQRFTIDQLESYIHGEPLLH